MSIIGGRIFKADEYNSIQSDKCWYRGTFSGLIVIKNKARFLAFLRIYPTWTITSQSHAIVILKPVYIKTMPFDSAALQIKFTR